MQGGREGGRGAEREGGKRKERKGTVKNRKMRKDSRSQSADRHWLAGVPLQCSPAPLLTLSLLSLLALTLTTSRTWKTGVSSRVSQDGTCPATARLPKSRYAQTFQRRSLRSPASRAFSRCVVRLIIAFPQVPLVVHLP